MTHAEPRTELDGPRDARQLARELEPVRERLRDEWPHLPLAYIDAAIEHGREVYGPARVKRFRAVLIERCARAELRAGPDVDLSEPPHATPAAPERALA